MVRLVERNLLSPLDQEAKRLVSSAATRVSIVTALSPRALVDMLFVFGSALVLIRRLAYLYGTRPGTLGLFRLVRLCIAHLTVTGGMALGDSLVQQVRRATASPQNFQRGLAKAFSTACSPPVSALQPSRSCGRCRSPRCLSRRSAMWQRNYCANVPRRPATRSTTSSPAPSFSTSALLRARSSLRYASSASPDWIFEIVKRILLGDIDVGLRLRGFGENVDQLFPDRGGRSFGPYRCWIASPFS